MKGWCDGRQPKYNRLHTRILYIHYRGRLKLTSIRLRLFGAQALATVSGPLTSGMVGIPITIEYDEAWDGLTKNLVCRCSEWGSFDGEYRTVLDVGSEAVAAHEVMVPGMHLYLGVEGYSSDGQLVMPTTWAVCGKIQHGANTGTDLSADPTLPVWGQLQAQIEEIKQVAVQEETVQAQINALHGMFKVCLFDDSKDVSGAIFAFETAFGITGGGEVPDEPEEPGVVTYAVAYELVNVSSDNRTTTVAEGAAYSATLTASDGYTMDGATVSVTMGGADITADVYADGVISIPAVTGNVSIMASAQVVEAEPELITDGLMAFWDFRQEKEPVVQTWHWAYPADVGDGGLYASIQGGSNGSKPLPTFGEQGTTSSFHIMLDSTTYPADVEIASEFTVVALSYGGMTTSHYIAATNVDPRWAFSTAYYTADGTKKITGPVGSGPDIQTGYDFVAIRVSGDTANVIANTSAHTFNGGDYADFDHWTRFAKVGALNNGVNVAYAVYNRALTDVEIENMRAFYKTMEVRA